MNIENAINGVITEKLGEGIIQKLVAENLEKGISNSLDNLLGNYGFVTKIIEKNIKDVMVKQLESYDYSKYIVKLDCVLNEILQHTSLNHKKILENFKELMIDVEVPKKVKVSDIFEQFCDHVSNNVETSDLKVNEDDTPSYETVRVTLETEYEEDRNWSSRKFAKLVFECEKDEDLNIEIRLEKYKEYPWELSKKYVDSMDSLKNMSKFEIYLLKLYQNGTKIEIDEEDKEEYVEVEAEPEASFS
jgi:hypothetical protein